jgi:hypothetical protein
MGLEPGDNNDRSLYSSWLVFVVLLKNESNQNTQRFVNLAKILLFMDQRVLFSVLNY